LKRQATTDSRDAAAGCRSYWTGFQTISGQVSTVTGNNLGAMNSSTYPYQHFVHYDASAGLNCVGVQIRHSYNQYKWW
jgi:hypothetical protein